MGIEKQGIKDLKLVYLHIAKTGGTSLNDYIPRALGIQEGATCNNFYRIPGWTKPLFSAPDKQLSSLQGRLGQCHFLTMEWPRGNMEPAMAKIGYNPGSYQVLASFREPLSHFLSAQSHLNGVKYLNDREDRKKSKSSNPNYEFGQIAFQDMIARDKAKKFYEYNLDNFQSRFMYPPGFDESDIDRIDEAIGFMHNLYWFSLLNEIRLSLALLQCQVFGVVDEALLTEALAMGSMISHSRVKYQFSEEDIHDLGSLLKVDNKFYEAVIYEFWKRVNANKECLAGELKTWGDYEVMQKAAVVPESKPRVEQRMNNQLDPKIKTQEQRQRLRGGQQRGGWQSRGNRQLEGENIEEEEKDNNKKIITVTCEHGDSVW